MKTVVAQLRPSVDYPQQDEVISSAHYAVRITAPEAIDAMEIAIDQGAWRACRHAVGYWWYDWSGYDPGEHEIVARARVKGGRWELSTPHEFMVAQRP